MSDLIAMDVFAPTGQHLRSRWLNRPITRYEGKVGELRRLLPIFQRRRGRLGNHEIVSNQLGETIVGRVSPNYVLVQHHELLSVLPKVISDQGYELDDLDAELVLTSYGERMELVIDLPSQSTTPPDGYPLACRLRCLNSVDGTTALEAELQWYRQICSNGMFGWAGERVRRVHRFDGALDWVQRRLHQRFEQLPGDRLHFTRLTSIPIQWSELQGWADVFVARKWGKSEAARVLHICQTGKDCTSESCFDDRPAHEFDVTSAGDVPGACAPVSNVYHVGQALSWVAGQSQTLHIQFSRTASIPALLRYLMN